MDKPINTTKDIFTSISQFLCFQFVYIACIPFVVMFISVFLIYFISIFLGFDAKGLIDFLFMSGFLFNFVKANLILFLLVSVFVMISKRIRTFVKNCSQIFNNYIIYYDEYDEIRINKRLFYLLLFR